MRVKTRWGSRLAPLKYTATVKRSPFKYMLDDRRAPVYTQKGWFTVAERERLHVVMNVLALFEPYLLPFHATSQRPTALFAHMQHQQKL